MHTIRKNVVENGYRCIRSCGFGLDRSADHPKLIRKTLRKMSFSKGKYVSKHLWAISKHTFGKIVAENEGLNPPLPVVLNSNQLGVKFSQIVPVCYEIFVSAGVQVHFPADDL